MPADSHIHDGVLEHVTDMEGAGNVRRRDNNREDRATLYLRRIHLVDACFNPPLSPMRLQALGLVYLLKLHGKFQRSIQEQVYFGGVKSFGTFSKLVGALAGNRWCDLIVSGTGSGRLDARTGRCSSVAQRQSIRLLTEGL